MPVTALHSHALSDLLYSRTARHNSPGTQMRGVQNDASPIFGRFTHPSGARSPRDFLLSGNSPASPFIFNGHCRGSLALISPLPLAFVPLDKSPGLQSSGRLLPEPRTSSKTPRLPPPLRPSALRFTVSTFHSPSACATTLKFPH